MILKITEKRLLPIAGIADSNDPLDLITTLSKDVSSFGVAVFDSQCRYIEVNQFLAGLNGFSPQEHRNQTISSVVPELAPIISHFVMQVMETQQALRDFAVSAHVPPLTGPLRHWLVSFFPVILLGRYCVVHTVFETTERTRFECMLGGLVPSHWLFGKATHLTPKEKDVLNLIQHGNTTKEIAGLLAISVHTVSDHRKKLCKKLDLHSTAQLASTATSR